MTSVLLTPAPALHAPERLSSAPHYAPLAPCENAQFHLLVAQRHTLDATTPFVARLAQLGAPSRVLSMERATPLAIDATFCTSEDDLATELANTLAQCSPGTRLYLAGDEAFIWRMQRLARAAGLDREEIAATTIGAQRTVYCVHCAQAHDYATGDEVACTSCNVRLAVRGHFSERLGAWLGVCADADHPYAEARA
ncbi:dimethylamine monooxygenase subunit DmmA family protein [Paraburkholderia sp. J67]|uniref:dimethylamine monooxygenase subunit DmmA family protein n=1 Tax=Paraburkholderia sp. J67 TaxID=2805435 RepID=UPI002ABE586E|nr:dimethylamine monooxygenase subunit DmmA family protein [Paraburkholderia sp. J67]